MRRVFSVLLLVLGLLLLFSAPVYARPNADGDIIVNHVVRSGETIYCIARAYKVSPAAIIKSNLVPYSNWIYPGQVLSIPNVPALLPAGPTCARQDPSPPPPPACTCAQYHTAVAGDNLYRLSLKYKVNMWRIAECNKIHNMNFIRVGDVLCIPSQ